MKYLYDTISRIIYDESFNTLCGSQPHITELIPISNEIYDLIIDDTRTSCDIISTKFNHIVCTITIAYRGNYVDIFLLENYIKIEIRNAVNVRYEPYTINIKYESYTNISDHIHDLHFGPL